MTSIKNVLEYAEPKDALTTEVITTLTGGSLAEVSAEEIAGMNPVSLADRMKQEKLFVEDNANRMKIAKELLSLIKDSGISSAPIQPAPVPAVPQKIEVIVPKSQEQMSASELLGLLKNNPQDTEAFGLLRKKEPIASALQITDKVAIMLSGVLSIELTLAYCQYLSKKGASPQRQFKGGRPATIENAIGIKEKALKHPLIDGEIIQAGMDSYGNDWTNVPLGLMKALLWARTIGHQRFPKTVDPVDIFEKISTVPLPGRWADILADYQAAEANDEPEATINLTWREAEGRKAKDPKAQPEKKPGEVKENNNEAMDSQRRPAEEDFADLTSGFGKLASVISGAVGSSGRKEESAESFVRERVQGNAQNSGVDSTITGVFNNIVIDGVNCKFMAIALNTVKISGVGASGMIYTGPGASVKITGVNMTVRQKSRSWEQLKEIIDSEF